MHVDTLGIDHDGSSLFACTVTVALGGKGGTGLSISNPDGSHAATHNFTERGSAACFRPWWPHTSAPGTSEEVV